MQPRLLLTLIFLLSIVRANGTNLPLTARDVSLMLRAGDSNAFVMRELATRHFSDKLDLEKENMLVKAGAKAELIEALRSGVYAPTAEQSAKAQQQIVDINLRRAAEAEQARKLQAMHQQQTVQKNTAAMNAGDPNATTDYLKGCLVQIHNGSLAPVDDDAISKKKLIAYYFSAHWCAPCRKFTPKLVEYYKRVAPQHPEFEIVFVSSDKTAEAMESYMREVGMPWPAVAYAKRDEKPELSKAAGTGIPSLVLVESTGKLISSAYDGSKYRGPQAVLDDLDAIFAGKAPAQVAQATN